MERQMRIGLFDSGSGCLSVLHEAYHTLPVETEYIVYADLDHVPYGTQSREAITGYAYAGVSFLAAQGVDAVVVACNTATSVAIKYLRSHFDFPIVGMEPAVKPALEMGNGRVLVVATPVAIKGENLNRLVETYDTGNRVDRVGLAELVPFAEAELFEEESTLAYLRKELEGLDLASYSAVVLGCTHFNYFKPQFKEILGNDIVFVDGRHGTIRHLADLMGIPYIIEESPLVIDDISTVHDIYHTKFYISGRDESNAKQDEHWVRLLKRLEMIRHI